MKNYNPSASTLGYLFIMYLLFFSVVFFGIRYSMGVNHVTEALSESLAKQDTGQIGSSQLRTYNSKQYSMQFSEDLFARAPKPTHQTYASDEDSMARQIVAAEGNLLPISSKAYDKYVEGLTDTEVQYWTGYDDARTFFESFGIIIGNRKDGMPGWYECRLPKGWHIEYDDTPNASRDESVKFIADEGTEVFYLITMKDASDQTANIGGLWRYNPEDDESGYAAHLRTLPPRPNIEPEPARTIIF